MLLVGLMRTILRVAAAACRGEGGGGVVGGATGAAVAAGSADATASGCPLLAILEGDAAAAEEKDPSNGVGIIDDAHFGSVSVARLPCRRAPVMRPKGLGSGYVAAGAASAAHVAKQ